MRLSLSAVIALFLAGCVNVSEMPNFERMSEAELYEYNSQRPLSQMIVCSDGDRSFSRVRRRVCGTVEQMYGSTDQIDQIGVMHSLPGYTANESF